MPTEILIHISAPSRVQNDRTYRKQAQGFLNFNPVKRYDVDLNSEIIPSGNQEPFIAAQGHDPETIAPQEFAGVSSSYNVLDQASSFDGRTEHQNPFTESVVSESSFLGLDIVSTSKDQPHRLHNSTISSKAAPKIHVQRTPAPNRPKTAPALASPVGFAGHRRRHSDSWRTPPSVVPDSQPSRNNFKHDLLPSDSFGSSTQSVSPLAKRPRLPSTPRAKSGPLPFDSFGSSTGSASPLAKRPRHQSTPTAKSDAQDAVVYPKLPSVSFSSDQLQSSFVTAEEESSQRSEAASHIISTIHPPPPPTALAQPDTHITPNLQFITETFPLSKYFCPVLSTRPLKDLERGHWRARIVRGWSLEERAKFWEYLDKFVGGGTAGWGTWCEKLAAASEHGGRKDEAEGRATTKEVHMRTYGSNGGPGDTEGELKDEVVRVWCWGEAAPYIYLLLFMASYRKIKGSGAEWIDAGGEVIIKMP